MENDFLFCVITHSFFGCMILQMINKCIMTVSMCIAFIYEQTPWNKNTQNIHESLSHVLAQWPVKVRFSSTWLQVDKFEMIRYEYSISGGNNVGNIEFTLVDNVQPLFHRLAGKRELCWGTKMINVYHWYLLFTLSKLLYYN